MFRNYLRDPIANTPINLALTRIALSGYLIWVIGSTDWASFNHYPLTITRSNPLALQFLFPELVRSNLALVGWLAIVLLLLFAAGISVKYVAFGASIVVCYLGITRYYVNASWSTQMYFAASILLMFWALYHEQDLLTFDGVKKRASTTTGNLQKEATSLSPVHRTDPLRYYLVVLGLLYFGSGLAKLLVGGPAWISAINMGRHAFRPLSPGYSPYLRDLMLQFDTLLLLLAVGTIVLELGFLLAILTDKFLAWVIVMLLGMHIGIALVMGPIFLYTMVFLMLFFDWERAMAAMGPRSKIRVVYDNDKTWIRMALACFNDLDVNNSIQWHPRKEDSERSILPEGVHPNQDISLSQDGEQYCGYHAWIKLSSHSRVFLPVAVLFGWGPVASVGQRWYNKFLGSSAQDIDRSQTQ